jgi:hypothetical protein
MFLSGNVDCSLVRHHFFPFLTLVIWHLMEKYQFQDSAVRPVEKSDVLYVVRLFEISYRGGHPHPELYDEKWVQNAINGEDIIWLLIEEEGEVVASVSLELNYGDYNDQLGLIGRLVTRPGRSSGGLGGRLGSRIINALVSAAKDNVECVLSNSRTAHRGSQRFLEAAKLIAAGFLPHYTVADEKRESLVLYTNLYDEGRMFRSRKLPQVIPQVAPLADYVLSAMHLPPALDIVNDCPPYSDNANCDLPSASRSSLAQLRQIKLERPGDPLVFDRVSLNYGMPYLTRKNINYLTVVDNQETVGAIGYRVDSVNQVFKLTELIFSRAEIVAHLCAKAVDEARRQRALIIEVDLSAYDARIQQTFLNYGFYPVAYIPAMVIHNTHRLDIVKMIKLEIPYDPSGMRLTPEVRKIVSIVEKGFRSYAGTQSNSGS